MDSRFGLMMPADNPISRAIRKKDALIFSRIGSPKETLDTPRTVFPPNSSVTRRTVSKVVRAPFLSELTAMQSASMRISFFSIP